jgi:hypothetical protein
MKNLPTGGSGQRIHGLWSILYLPQVYNAFTSVVGAESVMKLLAERFARPRPEDRILDVGCGTARILQYLPVARYLGIDNNSRYIWRHANATETGANSSSAMLERSQ